MSYPFGVSARSFASAVSPKTEAVRVEVDRVLLEFLGEQRRVLSESGPRVALLVEEIERVVRAGGKRLRPLFCYWGHRAAGGGDGPEILRAASSLELLHTFAIVHDDVMDRSALRRGQPSSYRRMAQGTASSEPERFGMSAAILAGDLALTLADQLLLASGFGVERLAAASRVLHAMRAEVIGGQFLDLLAAAARRASPSDARRISVLKSGGYTVEKPLLIGAVLAGAPDGLLASLSRFGVPLGEAFQLRDDVLGAFGDPAVTGKDADSDFREGKQTLLVALARERLEPADRAFLDERLGAPDLAGAEVARIRLLLRNSGALREAGRVIGELLARARSALRDASLPEEPSTALAGLAELVVVRDL